MRSEAAPTTPLSLSVAISPPCADCCFQLLRHEKAEAVTPRPKSCYGTWLTALHGLQDLVRAVETLGSGIPYLADQILWRTVALGVGGDLVLLCWEVHPLQVLLELAKVEVTKVAQIHTHAPIFA